MSPQKVETQRRVPRIKALLNCDSECKQNPWFHIQSMHIHSSNFITAHRPHSDTRLCRSNNSRTSLFVSYSSLLIIIIITVPVPRAPVAFRYSCRVRRNLLLLLPRVVAVPVATRTTTTTVCWSLRRKTSHSDCSPILE
jgi:hypothetical protein